MPKKPKRRLPPIYLGEETIGQKIARLRKARGLSQKELATKIGIERTVLADYEIDRIRLYDEMVARFAIALGVTSDEILGLKADGKKYIQPSLKIVRRLQKIQSLPDYQQKALLQTIDMALKSKGK